MAITQGQVESFPAANTRMFIDGKWVTGDGESFEMLNPATEAVLAHIPSASPVQVEAAIAAARRCFDSGAWSDRSPSDRSAALGRLLAAMRRRRDDLIEIVIAESGCPRFVTEIIQVDAAIEHLAWYVDAAATGPRGGLQRDLPRHAGPPSASEGMIVREPIGVVAALTPYNVGLLAAVWKICGALAAGCTTVLMPSPRAQLQAIAFAEIVAEAGLPDGAFNLILGGPETGRQIVASGDVDMVTFTGSDSVGADVMRRGADTLKKVVLELGGKSPNIMLPGTDYAAAMPAAIAHFSMNAGQGCICMTRILVPRSDYDTAVAVAQAAIAHMMPGDPTAATTICGPLIRRDHRERVMTAIAEAIAAGGRIEAGGGEPAQSKGFFMNPVLLGNLAADAPIAQQELFGPVGLLIAYDDVEDAIRIANATPFGLHANIWGDQEDALAVARQVRAGTVTINGGGGLRPDAPFGGYGRSGIGREGGDEGFLEFFETKHIQWAVA